jgi:hypothetical protein
VPDGFDLRNLIQARFAGLDPLLDALNASLLQGAITRYNSEFGPRYFGRPPSELIPTEPRRLTEFRTRIGPLLEYGLGVTIDAMLKEDYNEELRLSFVPATQFPDFYVRDAAGQILLRVDMKALHDESAEYSSRFDLATADVQPFDDLLLYVAWAWDEIAPAGHRLVYPRVLEGLFVPAIDIAEERDRNLLERGGRFDATGRAVVPPQWNLDTNFGKIDRIVHPQRREADDLSRHVRAFLAFAQRQADAVRRAAEGEATEPTPTEDEAARG